MKLTVKFRPDVIRAVVPLKDDIWETFVLSYIKNLFHIFFTFRLFPFMLNFIGCFQ